jgi:hypothetical protein
MISNEPDQKSEIEVAAEMDPIAAIFADAGDRRDAEELAAKIAGCPTEEELQAEMDLAAKIDDEQKKSKPSWSKQINTIIGNELKKSGRVVAAVNVTEQEASDRISRCVAWHHALFARGIVVSPLRMEPSIEKRFPESVVPIERYLKGCRKNSSASERRVADAGFAEHLKGLASATISRRAHHELPGHHRVTVHRMAMGQGIEHR